MHYFLEETISLIDRISCRLSLNQLPLIFSMGDGAATIDLGNQLSESLNRKVLAMYLWLQQNRFHGLKDIITAYASLTLVYDPSLIKMHYQPVGTVFEWVYERLQTAYRESGSGLNGTPSRHRIPVFYGGTNGPDLSRLAAAKGLDESAVIHIHTGKLYRVYMIGFLPGFSYMGEVEAAIAHPRKEKPITVMAGSVGIAGSQTGIYPFNSPGGWNIIGRTPLQMFNAHAQNPVLIKAGDEVEFYAAEEEA
ncbi:5-oxoprolinase subunit PxpB [Paraflavitalea sp. CAU 1676]|uniref:5-oxoprolinase subunit PxpB n=1 Tax=Paraflavitalea sp. CAU 1676 TaxID=3032598 RepID=UPI0023DB0417|nr:5-oxoprolinase subunit PxpB [Paraflavitalea sp. CAU 1676]MDF2192862.1 5-oxoprolinase subunit PxpB [Paraflavitalea sp. CAU 1676]